MRAALSRATAAASLAQRAPVQLPPQLVRLVQLVQLPPQCRDGLAAAGPLACGAAAAPLAVRGAAV
eukprot:6732835-Prymnesium_polylepis.1